MTASELKEKRRLLSAEVRKLTREIELKEKQIITEFPKYYKFVELLPNGITNYVYGAVTSYNNTSKSYHCSMYRILHNNLTTSIFNYIAPSAIQEKYTEISLEEFTKAKNIIMSSNDDINSEKSKLGSVIIDITHKAKRELGML